MKHIIIIAILSLSSVWLSAQPEGKPAPWHYYFDKEEVVFEFDKASLLKAYAEKSISLDFPEFDWINILNNADLKTWSQEGWYLRKKDELTYQLRKKITDFQGKFQDAYKFIILNKDQTVGRDSTYNPSPNAQGQPAPVTFYLSGYRKAKEVILAGTFNNWDEQSYKMRFNADEDIWTMTINLSPGTYEYKFIIDGTWTEDPGNLNRRTNEHNTENSIVIIQANGEAFFQRPVTISAGPMSRDSSKSPSRVAADAQGNVRFKLNGFDNAHRVVLSGTFNNWNEHGLVCNRENNSWVYDLQLKPSRYEYKYIVDDNWLHDPNNAESVENEEGTLNSVVHVCKVVHFFLAGHSDAKEVALVGIFNNWDSKGIPMERRADGWHLDYLLEGGKQTYKFIVDGNWITDPANKKKETSWEGYINSVIFVR